MRTRAYRRPARRTRTDPPPRAARAPSSRLARERRRRSAPCLARARGTAQAPARVARAPESLALCRARLLERVGDLRRHVILVVLGYDLFADELAVVVQSADDDGPCPLA